MAEQHKDVFFVGVIEPVQVRRQILGCSKDVISNLRRYEHFRDLRREKAENIVRLKKLLEVVNFLNNKLRMELPKTKLRSLKVPYEAETSAQEFIPHPRTPAPRRELSTLDKLENELLELEAKLDRMK